MISQFEALLADEQRAAEELRRTLLRERKRLDAQEERLADLAPNRTWVVGFTYCRSWAGFVYVAFIVDVFAQKIVAWHCATSKDVELVMTPLRMANWQRQREGHPVVPGELISHADAGSQYTSIRFTGHLDLEGIRPSIGSVGDAYDCETAQYR